MKSYQQDYLTLYQNFLEENQKKFKTYCDANDDCKENHLETQYLNDACERLVHLRKKTEDGLTYLDKFKENLIDEFENASLYKYKKESYVNSFIERDLERIRKEHIGIYNEADNDYRLNNYCYYDFMINASRNDVLKFLAEHNVLRNILDDPKLLKLASLLKRKTEIKDETLPKEPSLILLPISDLISTLTPYISTQDLESLVKIIDNHNFEKPIIVKIQHQKQFIRLFGRLHYEGLINADKKELEIWLIKNFQLSNKKSSDPQILKKGTVYKYLVNQVYEKKVDDILIIGVDKQNKY